MHDIPLLINIAVALGVAFMGGVVARRLGLPTIVGYLLAGVAIGPFTPGFVGDIETISQLAELGVIFLMFGVGLHFSFRDLWKVRGIAIPGALGQMVVTTLLCVGLSQWWGWPLASGLVLGLALSIASTVVLLRGLTDQGWLNTPHGQVAVGWLVLEDLATVLILVILPAFAAAGSALDWATIGLTILKAALFLGLMLFIGARVVPWLLQQIAHTRSRELFILTMLVIALGTALGSAQLFGVSLALGAFVAGVVVSESPFSHQISADLVPFREAFAVLFFVSVGMLVNPLYLLTNAGHVLSLTGLIVIGKALIAAAIGFLFPRPARTALVVAAGLSQIGEFSFILGQAGQALGLLTLDQYSLILAGALLSITVNPFMFRLVEPAEKFLRRFPRLWRVLDRHGPEAITDDQALRDHVVIIGWGRVGKHIVEVLGLIGVPRLVVEADADRVEALRQRNIPTLFGDAANSEILTHTGLERARALVVALPDEAATEIVVATARQIAPRLPIITRAVTETGVRRLAHLGAQDVIHPELEGGLELVRHTLLRLGYPLYEVQKYADTVRHEHYDLNVNTEEEHRRLHDLMDAAQGIVVAWLELSQDSTLVGRTLAEADLRARTGASVVALRRGGRLIPNPKSLTVFQPGDRIGLIGDEAQIEAARQLMAGPAPQPEASA